MEVDTRDAMDLDAPDDWSREPAPVEVEIVYHHRHKAPLHEADVGEIQRLNSEHTRADMRAAIDGFVTPRVYWTPNPITVWLPELIRIDLCESVRDLLGYPLLIVAPPKLPWGNELFAFAQSWACNGHPANAGVTGKPGGARAAEFALLCWYVAHSELHDLVHDELAPPLAEGAPSHLDMYEKRRFEEAEFLYRLRFQSPRPSPSSDQVATGRCLAPPGSGRHPYCLCVATGLQDDNQCALPRGATLPTDHYLWLRCPCLVAKDDDTRRGRTRMCRLSHPRASHIMFPPPDIFQKEAAAAASVTGPDAAFFYRPMTADDVGGRGLPSPLVRGERKAYLEFLADRKLVEPTRLIRAAPATTRVAENVWMLMPAGLRAHLRPLCNDDEDDMVFDYRLLLGRWTLSTRPLDYHATTT